MDIDFTSMRDSIESLKSAINIYDEFSVTQPDNSQLLKVLQAGVIQNFAFTYEQCWKFMKRWIENNISQGITIGISRRELYRRSAENNIISDIDVWMEFHQSRNQTSHIYNIKIAEEVFHSAKMFLPYAQDLLNRLEERNT